MRGEVDRLGFSTEKVQHREQAVPHLSREL